MSEIPKAYEPQAVEEKWYQFWLDRNLFVADASSPKRAYSIVIPPPNVTGQLHMGHVLNVTIQDVLSRKARMDGKEVLWLPGTDHAGIATEGMVAKQLRKEEKKTKQDIGREEFLKRVWTWKEKHGGIITSQLKKLGCSCDWSRERFTMDPEYARDVQRVFVELYKKGLIYRGKRMVNWCPATQTALSDEEVEMKPQKGFMYHFKVEVVDWDADAIGNQAASPEILETVTMEILVSTAKQTVGPMRKLRCAIDSKTGGIKAFATLIVSETVKSRHDQISLDEATQLKLDSKLGDEIEVEVPLPSGFEEDAKKASKEILLTRIREIADHRVKSTGIWLTIATTRPETIPGDTAVAVNPKDARYAHLIGKHIVRPLPIQIPLEKKLIPIIGDEHVDFEFGTGVLKVTPAHDKADFEIGLRHHLPVVDIMNPNGTMNELAGESLAGLDRFEARKVAVERLKELGVMLEEKPYENNVGFSQRADVPIEPRLSEQWFLKYPSVKESLACVADGKMKFHPERWSKVYDHWLTNIQDWCISRQLWWGHRVPVWRKPFLKSKLRNNPKIGHAVRMVEWSSKLLNNTQFPLNPPVEKSSLYERQASDDPDSIYWWRYAKEDSESVELEAVTFSEVASTFLNRQGFTQDTDVLDTWFSSWLWPFATMGWTGDKAHDDKIATLQKFYPTTDLVTGPDIIFFWVARMIMAGYEFMGELPFKNVYFTGIIRDKQGRKMSKTLGNSPDPLELIAKYGADALRFGTMRSAPLGQDVLFDEKDVELGRNFCNKLWNACRFRQMQGGGNSEVQGEINPQLLTGDDKWILLKLNLAIGELTTSLAEYKFSEAAQTLYRFFWSEYCDWYVEATKAVLSRNRGDETQTEKSGTDQSPLTSSSTDKDSPPHPPEGRGGEGEKNGRGSLAGDALQANTLAVIDFVLSHTLRLFHPFLPFITEELWHGMGYQEDMPAKQGGESIMYAPWPKAFEKEFIEFYGLDDSQLQLTDKKYELVSLGRNLKREGNVQSGKKVPFVLKPAGQISMHDVAVLKILLNAETLEVDPNYAPKKGTLSAHSELGELLLPRHGGDLAADRVRLSKEIEKYDVEIEKVRQKLANPAFTQKVPAEVLREHEKRLADWEAKKQRAQAAMDALGE